MDHSQRTIETYDKIAGDYHVIATPEVRAWLEDSMREFFTRLPDPHPSVLVAGCGEGRDSRYLGSLGARVVSFDLSEGMLSLARAADPGGTYLHVDLREAHTINSRFDGIWACACLYHLTKAEFRACLRTFHQMLNPRGVLFLNLKLGTQGLDIACGTGDSMSPLLKFCDSVLGIDTSDEMLAAASAQGLRVLKSNYTEVPRHSRIDLLSTGMAFHWFDGAQAISAYKAASNPGAIWLIYNFAFAAHTTSAEFNDWFFKFYLKEFPSPPRNRGGDVKPADDSDLQARK